MTAAALLARIEACGGFDHAARRVDAADIDDPELRNLWGQLTAAEHRFDELCCRVDEYLYTWVDDDEFGADGAASQHA